MTGLVPFRGVEDGWLRCQVAALAVGQYLGQEHTFNVLASDTKVGTCTLQLCLSIYSKAHTLSP